MQPALRFPAERSPAAVRLADVQAAVGPEGEPVHPALEAAAEGEARPLIDAVDFLQRHSHHDGFRLIADEALPGERAELPGRGVPFRLARRLAHAAVGEPDRGAFDFGEALRRAFARRRLAVVEHPARHFVGALREGGILQPAQARLVPVELALLNVAELVAGAPFPLVVRVEQIPLGADRHAVGGSQAVGERFRLPRLRVDLHAPAAERPFGLVAAAEADVECHVHVTGFVHGRAETVFVVIAGDAPLVGDGQELVGDAIAVGIDDLGEFRSLPHENGLVVRGV